MKKVYFAVALAVAAFFVLAGCSGNASTSLSPAVSPNGSVSASPTPSVSAVTINAEGSDNVASLISGLGDLYSKSHPGIAVNAQTSDSNIGIAKSADGTADIGLSERELKDIEKSTFTDMKEQALCEDGIAIVVAKGNTVSGLTLDQVKSIFTGKTTDWSDVGGQAGKIKVYTMSSSSEIRKCFNSLFLGKDESGNQIDTDDSLTTPVTSSADLATALQDYPLAIGYMPLTTISGDAAKALDIGGVAATSDNIQNGSYPYYLKFMLITRKPSQQASDFLSFCLGSDAAAYIKQNGYIITGR